MNLPKSFFEPNSYKLLGNARTYLKDLLKAQELSKFNDLVGYTPPPDAYCPDPVWPTYRRRNLFKTPMVNRVLTAPPWPEPSLFQQASFNTAGYPNPDDIDPFPWPWPIGPWVRDFINERIFELILKSPLRQNSYDFIDVVKRENIAADAMNELYKELSEIQNTISNKLKQLKNSY